YDLRASFSFLGDYAHIKERHLGVIMGTFVPFCCDLYNYSYPPVSHDDKSTIFFRGTSTPDVSPPFGGPKNSESSRSAPVLTRLDPIDRLKMALIRFHSTNFPYSLSMNSTDGVPYTSPVMLIEECPRI
ncbi:MAG: hypothetical protein U9Q76_05015, partial [candidate division WOR-3 bacterium]|nr:hypothetical protein [candidate division WOR-3 bacterium]